MFVCVCAFFSSIDFSFLFVKYLIIFFYNLMSIVSLSFPSDCFLFVFSREEKKEFVLIVCNICSFSLFYYQFVKSTCLFVCLLMKKLEQKKKKQKSRKVDKKNVFVFVFLVNSICQEKKIYLCICDILYSFSIVIFYCHQSKCDKDDYEYHQTDCNFLFIFLCY
jgi:hypothetical protein